LIPFLRCEVSQNLTSLRALKLAIALLTAFLSLATLLTALTTLLPALLTRATTGFFLTTLTARSLLPSTLLTATLIFFSIVCHACSSMSEV
jgi:hypothetical protein